MWHTGHRKTSRKITYIWTLNKKYHFRKLFNQIFKFFFGFTPWMKRMSEIKCLKLTFLKTSSRQTNTTRKKSAGIFKSCLKVYFYQVCKKIYNIYWTELSDRWTIDNQFLISNRNALFSFLEFCYFCFILEIRFCFNFDLEKPNCFGWNHFFSPPCKNNFWNFLYCKTMFQLSKTKTSKNVYKLLKTFKNESVCFGPPERQHVVSVQVSKNSQCFFEIFSRTSENIDCRKSNFLRDRKAGRLFSRNKFQEIRCFARLDSFFKEGPQGSSVSRSRTSKCPANVSKNWPLERTLEFVLLARHIGERRNFDLLRVHFTRHFYLQTRHLQLQTKQNSTGKVLCVRRRICLWQLKRFCQQSNA